MVTPVAQAQPKEIVSVQGAWVRATSLGQEVGAAYMSLVSSKNATLIRVESDVTKSIEIHSMKMEGDVMKMRMLESLPLQSGKAFKLEPNGFHLMLFDLKKPLLNGGEVNFVLTFRSANKSEFKQNVRAPIRP